MTYEHGTMPLEEALDLHSVDYYCPMREVYPKMEGEGEDCWHQDDGILTCWEWVDILRESMEKDGWTGPPIFVREPTEHQKTRDLANGHHRLMAAMQAGFTEVPFCHDWSESGGQGWK